METVHAALAMLFAELIDGPTGDEAYMLNRRDPGLLLSLDLLSADAASRIPESGGASIAAHVDHVCYGLDLMLRWSDGEANPWAGADWSASWRRPRVTAAEWDALRERLKVACRRWRSALASPRPLSPIELNGVIASVGHLAYHLGAIRQIDPSIRGPKAEG